MPMPPPESHWQSDAGDTIGVADRGQQRLAAAARGAIDQRLAQPQRLDHAGERVGILEALAFAVEAQVRFAGVGPVPHQHLVAVAGHFRGQLAHPGRIARKAAARRDGHGLGAVADQVIGDRQSVYLDPWHPLSPFYCSCSMISRDNVCRAIRQTPSALRIFLVIVAVAGELAAVVPVQPVLHRPDRRRPVAVDRDLGGMDLVAGFGRLDRAAHRCDERRAPDLQRAAAGTGIHLAVLGEQLRPGVPLLGIEQPAIGRLDVADRQPVGELGCSAMVLSRLSALCRLDEQDKSSLLAPPGSPARGRSMTTKPSALAGHPRDRHVAASSLRRWAPRSSATSAPT